MKSQRQFQISEQIAHLAAEFLQRESNRQSMVTITRADVSPDLARATVYFTVIPENHEEEALNFAKRKRSDFRTYIKKHTNLRRLPYVDFIVDKGERNRQHLDTLT